METRDTKSSFYARRLYDKQHAWWKRLLNVQAPYQWNLRRQRLGRTLEVGCGIGRNLATLGTGSVGVDHNADAVAIARSRGFTAMTAEEFHASEFARPAHFEGMLLAHVVEHLTRAEAERLIREYLPYLKPSAKVFIVCPQERGYASDASHVQFADAAVLRELCVAAGLSPGEVRSFPFPRVAGRLFTYNEFCLLATVPQ